MNVSDFKKLLQDPNTILSPRETRELEAILEEYPYFQAARALQLKGLKNLESYKYNTALKVTAAHTTDREILFDYITSKEFDQNHIANSIMGRETTLTDKQTISEEIEPNPDAAVILGETDESPLPQNIQHAEKILDPKLFDNKFPPKVFTEENSPEKQLELGKPLAFTKGEKHSFTEWLQLAQKKPIGKSADDPQESLDKKKKFALLDKFIENNPKIVPKEDAEVRIDIKESSKIDTNELMTETLAKVYLEQKKYKKAVQAYKILSLKYPEKSGFFADQIKAVKKLQKEKD
ncbi:tetratricopeptide repeat protein [Flavobacteriaceae bacterium GF1]